MLARHPLIPDNVLMAFVSLACSLLLFMTGWTGLSFFILGPFGIYFAWRSYQRTRALIRPFSAARRLLALTPLFIAIAVIPLTLMLVSATYRA
jgi:hypothetical protein